MTSEARNIASPLTGTSAQFEQLVVDASQSRPVLVDFWAAWCGPCRMIAPLVERLAADYAERALVAKVDTDAEPELAARCGVRSLPTLAVFRGGRLVDALIGAQPEGVIRELLDRHLDSDGDRARRGALEAAAAGRIDEAIATLERAVETEPERPAHRLALLDVLLDAGRLDAARERLAHLPIMLEAAAEIETRRARLEILAAAAIEGAIDSPERRHADAARAFLAGDHETALERWLELMRTQPRWADGAAQRALRAAFTLLGEHDELAVRFRRRMAALLH
jgi:putative thioredoxin